MDITELSTILFDPQGPSKIGIELEVEDTDGSISDTAHSDLYEFLLNLLIIGINKFNLTPANDNFEYIEVKLQHYFNRINILLDIQPVCIDDVNDSNIYCKIYNANNTGIKIVINPSASATASASATNIVYNHISEVCGFYIFPDVSIGTKRTLSDFIYGLYIKFNYIF